MIAFVRGPVAGVTAEGAVIDVGGVGLAVVCTPAALARLRIGEEARLATSLVVREDSLTLFGFADDEERRIFELLQTASGVGPRLAAAMLAVHSPDGLRRAVATEDTAALMRVPGIGRKGAQRILLELRDRLGPPEGTDSAAVAPSRGVAGLTGTASAWRQQVHAGLVGLGWAAREAEEAVSAVVPDAETAIARGDQPDVAALLRAALRTLSRV